MAQSDVQLCNGALSLIGARATIASLSPPDGTVEAGLCATFLPISRRVVIENGSFQFANKRAVLAQLSVNDSKLWRFAYAVPHDCLIPMRVVRVHGNSKAALFMSPHNLDAAASMLHEADGADFYQEDGTIYTNEPEAVLLYKRDVLDPRFYTPGFELAVSMTLASFIAGPLIGGADGARIGASWGERAADQTKRAAANSANSGKSTLTHAPNWMYAR